MATLPQNSSVASVDRRRGALACVATVVLLALLVVRAAHAVEPCTIEASWPNLADCPLDARRDVTIGGAAGCGPSVYVDHTTQTRLGEPLGIVTIAPGGLLVFADEAGQDAALSAGTIDVQGDAQASGTLQVGAPACPITRGTATVTFHGDRASASVPADMGMNMGTHDVLSKGILVEPHASLLLYGGKGVAQLGGATSPSWTHLAAPAGPESGFSAADGVLAPVPAGGSRTLRLASAVDWEPGDWIVVAPTDFVPYGSEFVLVKGVTANADGTTTVALADDTPLVNYHFGGLAPSTGTIPAGQPYAGLPASFGDGPERNWGIDERAEVGLVSRRVKLTAEVAASGDAMHWGGEIRILPGFARVEVQGVEIEKFGKDQTGSYPIHFHMAGDVDDAPIVNSNTVHHSFNKCVTIHYTDGLTVANNVCARVVDHAIYVESAPNASSPPSSCAALPVGVPGNGNVLTGNLVVSTMSNGFRPRPGAVDATRWFAGDYLTNGKVTDPARGVPNGYDGFDIPSTTCDDQASQPVPSGFWLTSPANVLRDNSVAGCQGQGRAYWFFGTTQPFGDSLVAPFAEFADNRAHGCALGLDTSADLGVNGDRGTFGNLEPLDGDRRDVLAKIERFTATRIRDRGIWIRDKFYHVSDARLATNRDSISLVSGGGPESSKPGIWSLLSDSVLAGETRNNPGRFGDCPLTASNGNNTPLSCVETDQNALGKAYPSASWNSYGFMFYDGPARLENNRFVNFKRDISEFLTTTDRRYLALFQGKSVYEGDAAFGWFQSNKNAYPPTQYAQATSWENVDFRHQVYTSEVNQGDFSDGDKNTVLLDRDGTMSGLAVVGPGCKPENAPCPVLARRFPISLNNLGFNMTPFSVDECHATGAQDAIAEGRPSALMSPHDVAGLEVSLPTDGDQPELTFWRDTVDFGEHQSMTLGGRNDTRTYEPKVINQLGYTMGAESGVAQRIGVGLVDAHAAQPLSTANPFRVRLGICYRTASGTAPPAADADAFAILRGRKSWGSPSLTQGSLTSAGVFRVRKCNNLDTRGSTDQLGKNCPSDDSADVISTDKLRRADSLDALTSDTYFYDADAGMLYFLVEETAEGSGPSPLGSCPADSAACKVQDWYQCPANGCQYYVVQAPASYAPNGATTCAPYAKGPPYEQEYPATLNRLAYVVPRGEEAHLDPATQKIVDGELVQPVANVANPKFPHYEAPADKQPWCPETWAGPLPAKPSSCADAARARVALATGAAVGAAGDDGTCSAFLPRSIGFAARVASQRPAVFLTASDWIATASYALHGPVEVVSAEDQGGIAIDPARAHYLAYDAAPIAGPSQGGARRGIVVSDEIGRHVLDAGRAERVLLPAGVSVDGSVPAERHSLWDSYACYRVTAADGAAARAVAIAYTDTTGTHRVKVPATPSRLCVESDVGDGLGNEISNVACYPIAAGARAIGGAGALPLLGATPGNASSLALDATDRFGTIDLLRGGPREICLAATIVDRGS